LTHDHLQHSIVGDLDLLQQLNQPLKELMSIEQPLVIHVLRQLHPIVPLPHGHVNIDH
jgi:hypothetical protein